MENKKEFYNLSIGLVYPGYPLYFSLYASDKLISMVNDSIITFLDSRGISVENSQPEMGAGGSGLPNFMSYIIQHYSIIFKIFPILNKAIYYFAKKSITESMKLENP